MRVKSNGLYVSEQFYSNKHLGGNLRDFRGVSIYWNIRVY